jgi:hypothetical protein
VKLESPTVTATKATLGLLVGGGFLVGLARSDSRPYGTAELSVRVRPSRWREMSWIAEALRYPDYDFALGYLLSTQPYEPLHAPDNSEDTGVRSVLYNRFVLSAFALFPAFNATHVGPGLGGGVGYAFYAVDEDEVGEPRFFFALPALRARYEVNPRFAFTLTTRLLWPDSFYEHSSPDDFRGTTNHNRRGNSWFLLDLGLQGWL